MLTALDVDGAISTVSGDKVPFSTLVECVGEFFHVSLGKATEVKRTIYDRKFTLTSYLEALAAKLNQAKNIK